MPFLFFKDFSKLTNIGSLLVNATWQARRPQMKITKSQTPEGEKNKLFSYIQALSVNAISMGRIKLWPKTLFRIHFDLMLILSSIWAWTKQLLQLLYLNDKILLVNKRLSHFLEVHRAGILIQIIDVIALDIIDALKIEINLSTKQTFSLKQG